MDDDQQFCLRWNNHQSTLISVFDTLLENETLVDCTLAAEGKFLKAHKVVLSACSPYFAALLQEQYDKHPIFILKDVKYQELRAMMDYMYRGEVNISQDQLAALLKAAESLQIKGLSDNRSGSTPKPEHHRGLNVPVANSGGVGKLGSGYTLEQTKRARVGPSSMDSQDMTGSREGSSSPSRRRRKVRRRSIENAMTADVHDNSNSSQANQSALLQQQTNASLAGVGAITAAASALASQMPVSAVTLPTGSNAASGVVAVASNQGPAQQMATNMKKTESGKLTSDAMNAEQGSGASVDEHEMEQSVKAEKQNHKQKSGANAAVGKEATELVIEPKSEYDDEGNDETVEDLTLDDEDMGMDDLDHNAGTSQGGEGSSQGYAPWQHDRSQDDLLLATQEAQQRDPQDLSNKYHKESSDSLNPRIQISNQRSILNTNNSSSGAHKRSHSRNSLQSEQYAAPTTEHVGPVVHGQTNGNRKRLSMSDVSDMLFELYKAKAPKNQQALLANKIGQISPTSAETHEPSSIAAIATNGAAAGVRDSEPAAASKNLQDDEMVPQALSKCFNNTAGTSNAAPFHPRIKYTNAANVSSGIISSGTLEEELRSDMVMTSIPTSVVVPTTPQVDIKPILHPTTGLVLSGPSASAVASVIKQVPPQSSNVSTQAAAIAAALLRDGYHSFQQQIRAQEILKQQQRGSGTGAPTPTKILESFLRQHRNSECEEGDEPEHHGSDTNDGDDEDDSRYNGFDDIHLVEHKTNHFGNNSMSSLFQSNAAVSSPPTAGGYHSDDQKYALSGQAQMQSNPNQAQMPANDLRNLEYSLSDYGSGTGPEPVYECRHCGKKYRWKSTLRRHENVECGGKEPSHQCPYCPYKSKQRGNLGVHVRKHHSNLPQLASKRRSKYSQQIAADRAANSAMGSDDSSSSKLVIDCSK